MDTNLKALTPDAPSLTTTVLKRRPEKSNGERPAGARAVIYGRLSRVEEDGTETATKRQIEDCSAYCERMGWKVVGTYVDSDYSGYDKDLVRPDFEALLSDVTDGKADVVVVWKMDRLTRQPPQLERLLGLMEQRQAGLSSVTEPLPGGEFSPAALMMIRQMVSMASYESAVKSERQLRANRERAKRGEPANSGGYRPFGFEDDGVTQIPEEAEAIREAAERVLDGWPLGAICRDWTARGITTPTRKAKTERLVDRSKPGAPKRRRANQPGQWRPSSLRNMLLSPRLAGLRAYHHDIVTGEYDLLVKGRWEPILEQEVWEAVCVKLRMRKERRDPIRTYLLSGWCWCGRCGTKLRSRPNYHPKTRERIPRYMCPSATDNSHVGDAAGCGANSVKAELAEQEVASRLMAYVSQSEDFKAKVMGWRVSDEKQKAITVELNDIEDQLKEADHDYRVRSKGDPLYLPRDRFMEVVEKLEGRREVLRRQQRSGRAMPVLQRLVDDPVAVWESWTFDERRACLEQVLSRVTIHESKTRGGRWEPERVEVTWKV